MAFAPIRQPEKKESGLSKAVRTIGGAVTGFALGGPAGAIAGGAIGRSNNANAQSALGLAGSVQNLTASGQKSTPAAQEQPGLGAMQRMREIPNLTHGDSLSAVNAGIAEAAGLPENVRAQVMGPLVRSQMFFEKQIARRGLG